MKLKETVDKFWEGMDKEFDHKLQLAEQRIVCLVSIHIPNSENKYEMFMVLYT